jgi:carbamoyltransferase
MEFGPRALCNRSIIYKTSDKSINDWLNKRMRRTEFMPFAPVVRNNTAKKAFIKYQNNDPTFNFMT